MTSVSNSNSSSSSTTSLFRRLTWQSNIQLEITLVQNIPGQGNGVDKYYMQAPRYTYLPLLIREIRENLVELCLDDQQLAESNEADWWFEEDVDQGGFASQGPCKWHWPLDLIALTSQITHPHLAESSTQPRPLRLKLHLSSPPNDKLMMPNSVESCKTQFVNQVKEGDFVRWGNTKKVTGLRRADLEAGWDGIVQDDYDLHTRMSSRIFPLPIPPPPTSPAPTSTTHLQAGTTAQTSRPPSTDPEGSGSASKPDSSYAARALPIKIYLPDGAPVVQEVFAPISSDGKPTTIIQILRHHLPLLFPPTPTLSEAYTLSIPLIQGIEVPPETEIAWAAACLCGADGWVRIGVMLRGE